MTTKTTDKSTKSERSPIAPHLSGKSAKSNRAQAATTIKARDHAPSQKSGQAPTTKHTQILKLLSRVGGASIEELMRATNWQQHSVRGFLAGTVKKKLGLAMTSLKANGVPIVARNADYRRRGIFKERGCGSGHGYAADYGDQRWRRIQQPAGNSLRI